MGSMKVDILAIGVHPDDVELSCSGTLIKHQKAGKKVAVVDLTRGELGTRGTAETRDVEAADAAKIMGLSDRMNLCMADGFFQNDEAHQRLLIQAIRYYQPAIILANAIRDRHPDHGRAAQLIKDAAFYSGLAKIETEYRGQAQAPWRPSAVYHYIQDYWIDPDFVVDISAEMDTKMEAVLAYKTQFHQPGEKQEGPVTPISTEGFQSFLRARMRQYGRLINASYGEGFVTNRAMGIDDLLAIQ